MSGLDLGQMIAHGFAKLTGAQRSAGETSPVAATETGSVVLPDGTEMMRSASGNIGLGVTPSPWNSAVKAFQFGLSGSISANDGANYVEYGNNFYRDSVGADIYKSNGAACKIELQTDGSFRWKIAPSGTAGNPISFTQAMTLDASGNLGIGASPVAGLGKAQVAGNMSAGRIGIPIQIQDTNDTNYGNAIYIPHDGGSSTQKAFRIRSSYSTGALHFDPSTNLQAQFTDPATLTYGTGIMIDSSGNLRVGTTVQHLYEAKVVVSYQGGSSGAVGQSFRPLLDDGYPLYFFNAANAPVGGVSTSATATSYNTSSDARLKENIGDADNSSALIDQLQVRKFDWKADGSHQRYGFIAQELYTVYPEAVSKPADPEEMMGVDYSKLVPLLVQEIQSLRARVAALETI